MPENDPAALAEATATALPPTAPVDPLGSVASPLPDAATVEPDIRPASTTAAPDTPSAGPVDAPARGPEMSAAECAQRLADLFPALFGPAQTPMPIKLRVQVDIQARAPGVFTRRVLSAFLSRYTTTTAYLKALVQAPHRVDLDGQPAGEVSDVHRQAATEELERRRALQEARRQTYRQAHREAQRQAGRPPQPPGRVELNTGVGDMLPPAAAADAGAAGELRPRRGTPNPGRPRHPGHPDRAGRPVHPNRLDPAGMAPTSHEGRGPRGPGQRPRGLPAPVASSGEIPGVPSSSDTRAQDPAEVAGQRERAALLRAYETSTLSKSNFCVLKRLSEAELDAQLARARQERVPVPGRVVR